MEHKKILEYMLQWKSDWPLKWSIEAKTRIWILNQNEPEKEKKEMKKKKKKKIKFPRARSLFAFPHFQFGPLARTGDRCGKLQSIKQGSICFALLK